MSTILGEGHMGIVFFPSLFPVGGENHASVSKVSSLSSLEREMAAANLARSYPKASELFCLPSGLHEVEVKELRAKYPSLALSRFFTGERVTFLSCPYGGMSLSSWLSLSAKAQESLDDTFPNAREKEQMDAWGKVISAPITSPQFCVEILSLLCDIARSLWDMSSTSSILHGDVHVGNMVLDLVNGSPCLRLVDLELCSNVEDRKASILADPTHEAAVSLLEGDEDFDSILDKYVRSLDLYNVLWAFDRVLRSCPFLYRKVMGRTEEIRIGTSLSEFKHHDEGADSDDHFLIDRMRGYVNRARMALHVPIYALPGGYSTPTSSPPGSPRR
jgi:hypothetical protein